MKPETIKIDEVEYVRADSVGKKATRDGLEYCVVRSARAGVFAGYIASREGQEVAMHDARRIWYWDGAASLSQLAMSGTSKPENCKFPEPVDYVLVFEVIEIIPCTEKARKSIEGVKVWKK